jgi:hypothetical protein
MVTRHLKPYEFFIKWSCTALVIAGAYCTALDIVPLNKVLLLISSFGWTAIGFLWRQPSLWVLNLYLIIVYGWGVLR